MAGRSVFVAATRQNVGKTSLSLGLVSALKGRGVNVGFMKPVGQQHVSVQGIDEQTGQPVTLQVDKDCRLFNEFFSLGANYSHMYLCCETGRRSGS